MLNTYQAELHEGRINWIGQKPEEISNDHTYKVEIQIIKKADKKKVKSDLAHFFQNSPLKDIKLDLKRSEEVSRKFEL